LHYTPILLATLRDNAAAATAMLNAGATTDINTVCIYAPFNSFHPSLVSLMHVVLFLLDD